MIDEVVKKRKLIHTTSHAKLMPTCERIVYEIVLVYVQEDLGM